MRWIVRIVLTISGSKVDYSMGDSRWAEEDV